MVSRRAVRGQSSSAPATSAVSALRMWHRSRLHICGICSIKGGEGKIIFKVRIRGFKGGRHLGQRQLSRYHIHEVVVVERRAHLVEGPDLRKLGLGEGLGPVVSS